jgi:cell division inhibitor SulA
MVLSFSVLAAEVQPSLFDPVVCQRIAFPWTTTHLLQNHFQAKFLCSNHIPRSWLQMAKLPHHLCLQLSAVHTHTTLISNKTQGEKSG